VQTVLQLVSVGLIRNIRSLSHTVSQNDWAANDHVCDARSVTQARMPGGRDETIIATLYETPRAGHRTFATPSLRTRSIDNRRPLSLYPSDHN